MVLLCFGISLPIALSHAQGPAGCAGADDQLAGPATAAASTLCLVAQARAAAGVPALTVRSTLSAAAGAHAGAMVATDTFSTTGADGSTPASRAAAANYRGAASEVIGFGNGPPGTPRAVVDRWLADPPARAILLFAAARDAGAGVRIADGGRFGKGTAVYSVVVGSPKPSATPVPGKSVVVRVISGHVTVRRRGGRTTTLAGSAAVPLGATVDASAGRLDLTAAADRAGATQHSAFYQGAFVPGQQRDSSGLITVLRLTGSLDCSSARRTQAGAARIRRRARRRKRILWGDGKGRYRTVGNEASATVRGTLWRTEDTCAGTRVSVTRGVVRVTARRTGRVTDVTAGQSILIKKR